MLRESLPSLATRLDPSVSLGEYTRPHGVVFLAGNESRVVVTSEATQRLLVVNIETGRVESAIPTNANGSHMAGVTADGKRAFTANIGSGSVSEIDLVERKFVRNIPVGPRAESIAVTPDGKEVGAGSNTDGTVSIVETATGQVAAKLSGFTLPYRLAISADGHTAIICDPQANRIAIADVAMRRVIWDGLLWPLLTSRPDAPGEISPGKTPRLSLHERRIYGGPP